RKMRHPKRVRGPSPPVWNDKRPRFSDGLVFLDAQLTMQRADLGRTERVLADLEHGSAQADRRCMFHGKAHGLIGAAKITRALCQGGCRVAAEIEFTRRLKNLRIH